MSDRLDRRLWGRRPFADREAREILNDASEWIVRHKPDDVDDPHDPQLSDVLKYVPEAKKERHRQQKLENLSRLFDYGLTFQESVCFYWWFRCGLSLTDIHYAIVEHDVGGDPEQRRNSLRNINRVLESAAFKHPETGPDDVPDLSDVIGDDDAESDQT